MPNSDDKSDPKPDVTLPGEGQLISRNEIMDVLANEGYSSEGRKDWLKSVLTRMASQPHHPADPERDALVAEIREILHGQVSNNPKADDTL